MLLPAQRKEAVAETERSTGQERTLQTGRGKQESDTPRQQQRETELERNSKSKIHLTHSATRQLTGGRPPKESFQVWTGGPEVRKGAGSQWEASTQPGTTKGPQERPSQMTPSRGSQVHTGLQARDERAREPLPTLPQTPLPQQPGQTQLLEVTGHCCRPMTRPSGTPLHPLCSCFSVPLKGGGSPLLHSARA